MKKISKKDAKMIDCFIGLCQYLRQYTLSSVPAPYYAAYRILVMGKSEYKEDVQLAYISDALRYFTEKQNEKS